MKNRPWYDFEENSKVAEGKGIGRQEWTKEWKPTRGRYWQQINKLAKFLSNKWPPNKYLQMCYIMNIILQNTKSFEGMVSYGDNLRK